MRFSKSITKIKILSARDTSSKERAIFEWLFLSRPMKDCPQDENEYQAEERLNRASKYYQRCSPCLPSCAL